MFYYNNKKIFCFINFLNNVSKHCFEIMYFFSIKNVFKEIKNLIFLYIFIMCYKYQYIQRYK